MRPRRRAAARRGARRRSAPSGRRAEARAPCGCCSRRRDSSRADGPRRRGSPGSSPPSPGRTAPRRARPRASTAAAPAARAPRAPAARRRAPHRRRRCGRSNPGPSTCTTRTRLRIDAERLGQRGAQHGDALAVRPHRQLRRPSTRATRRRRTDRRVHVVGPRIGRLECARGAGRSRDRIDRTFHRDTVDDAIAARRLRQQPGVQLVLSGQRLLLAPARARRGARPRPSPPAPRARRRHRGSCRRAPPPPRRHAAGAWLVDRLEPRRSGSAAARRGRRASRAASDPARSARLPVTMRGEIDALGGPADDAIARPAASAATSPVTARPNFLPPNSSQ